MARPKKPIDEEQLIKCAEKQWTTREIAAFFRVSTDTIERRYAAQVEEARQSGRAKLRDLQWARAINGSDTMLKHMSEHYLDQHSKSRISIEDAWDSLPSEKKAVLIKKDLENGGE
jgi:DNA-directed RNA polymerase specialized sigma24 family protein